MKAGRSDPFRVGLGRVGQNCSLLLQRLGSIAPAPKSGGKGGVWALSGRFSAGTQGVTQACGGVTWDSDPAGTPPAEALNGPLRPAVIGD